MIKVMATVPEALLDEYNKVLDAEEEKDLYGISTDGVGDCSNDVLRDTAYNEKSEQVTVDAAYLIEEIRYNFTEKFPSSRMVDFECGYISRQKLTADTHRWEKAYEDFKSKAEAAAVVEPWLVCEIPGYDDEEAA